MFPNYGLTFCPFWVHFSSFGPFQSKFVYFGLFWSNLVEFDPLWSTSVHSNFILFGPILSIQSTSVFFIHFALTRSNLVQFNLFKLIQTTLVHLKMRKHGLGLKVISIVIYMISFDYYDNLKRMRNLNNNKIIWKIN